MAIRGFKLCSSSVSGFLSIYLGYFGMIRSNDFPMTDMLQLGCSTPGLSWGRWKAAASDFGIPSGYDIAMG